MENPKRSFDNVTVDDSKQYLKFLTGALLDCRRGVLDHDEVKSITLIADKINKANTNEIDYKKVSKHKKKLDFYEKGLKDAPQEEE